jgi:hypothetical protein
MHFQSRKLRKKILHLRTYTLQQISISSTRKAKAKTFAQVYNNGKLELIEKFSHSFHLHCFSAIHHLVVPVLNIMSSLLSTTIGETNHCFSKSDVEANWLVDMCICIGYTLLYMFHPLICLKYTFLQFLFVCLNDFLFLAR